ncbi:peptidase M23 [Neisseria arctica]|uniref:Peptidase M23 n=1 Tax=Neisseria arctica TaxID=1470200 RepID=A0A0J0YR00_9NEIS|nr:peptidoglycan DD-metalloendopeptidase family protein [Neisseria arctica]KLT72539.1 peptidase M23 [Neisseria arctica]UOO87592.1 peptidoglycan DD-metalloendopeptidase family protein [Neisseria arctica]
MLLKPLLLAVLIGLSLPVSAAPESTAGDLQEIQKAISAAQADLREKQAAQKSAQQALEKSRAALSKAQQELNEINKKQRAAWEKLQALQNELGRLKIEVSGAKAQVSRLLAGHYKNRQPNAVVLFLKNAEPGQKARYLQYTRYINEANQKVINDLISQQQALVSQEAAIDAEVARLNKLKAQKQAALGKLNRNNSSAQQESRRLSAQIDSQTQRIAKLRADEQKLNNLLADIARRNAEKRRQEAAARKKSAEARIAAANKARVEAAKKGRATAQSNSKNNDKKTVPTTSRPIPQSTLTAEDRALQAPAEVQTVSGGFSTMQGRLRRPVGGSISGRFGQARPSGGNWRGVFFATAPAPVQSIASGTVAYAGSLSGYGNIVIIDHGDSYLSVYSGLSNIAVGNGSRISAGSRIGTSGTLPSGEQGLYFEIRHRQQAMNPLSWVR